MGKSGRIIVLSLLWGFFTQGIKATNVWSLSSCKLSYVPRQVMAMTQLTRLYLAYNDLTELPRSFKNLENLQTLNLAFNKFAELPLSVRHLQSLEVLEMRGNKLTRNGLGKHSSVVAPNPGVTVSYPP